MNKLFKHAFDPFQGKYFAVFLPVKRYSYPQEILLCSKFPLSLLIVRQLNFFELELHRRSSHRRTILSEQVSANSVAPIRKKILRCFPRRDHPPLSTWGWLLQWPGSPSIYNSEPDERNKTREEGC